MVKLPSTREAALELVKEANGDPAGVVARLQPSFASATAHLTTVDAILAWALGLALRNLRDFKRAQPRLQQAITHLDVDSEDHTGASLSLAGLHAHRGEFDQALNVLHGLQPAPHLKPRVVFQRAAVFEFRGDIDDAERGYRAASEAFLETGDRLGEAHALSGLGLIEVHRGAAENAMATFALARATYDELELPLLVAVADYNIGFAATEAGHLDTALRYLERSRAALRAMREPFNELALVHVYALSAAGLVTEASERAIAALPEIEESGAEGDRAEMLLALGHALNNGGQSETALKVLAVAASLFARQGRDLWTTAARLAVLEAEGPSRHLDELTKIRQRFAELGSNRSIDADLILAKVADQHGDASLLAELAARSVDPADPRHALIRCLSLAANGRDQEVSVTVTAELSGEQSSNLPLDVRASHISSRNHLVRLGLESALRLDRPAEFATLVTLVRRILHSPRGRSALSGEIIATLRRDHAVHEWRTLVDRIRAEGDRRPIREFGTGGGGFGVHQLGELLVIADVGNVFAAAHIDGADATYVDLGDRREFYDAVHHHLRAVAAAALGDTAAVATRDASAARLRYVLPHLAATDKPLNVMHYGAVEGVPWNSIANRPVRILVHDLPGMQSISPTQVAGISGPEVASGAAELAALKQVYGERLQLYHSATPDELLDAVGGIATAHLCCHGEFISENPMLSYLRLSDGRLTGYEIERLAAVPQTVVTAACRAGETGASENATAALGMSMAWLAAGAHSVVAPVCPIPDSNNTVAAMIALHQGLNAGTTPEVAVWAARKDHDSIARTFAVMGRPVGLQG